MKLRAQLTPLVLFGLLTLPASQPARADGMELEHQATRDLVDFVNRAAELVGKEGAAACAVFKQQGGEWFEGERYIFLLDMQGQALCHPNSSLQGRDLGDLRDPDGRPILKLMMQQLERGAGDGWIHYLWPRPGKTILTWKTTYVRETTAPGGDALVVGGGAYNLVLEKAFIADRVQEAAELIGREGEPAFDVLRDKAGGFRFYDTYVFVMSSDGVMRVNPGSPELEGTSVLDLEDENGVRPGVEMLKILTEQDEGWVSYLWPRPGDRRASPKESYVTRVEVGGQQMIVGAGVYRPR